MLYCTCSWLRVSKMTRSRFQPRSSAKLQPRSSAVPWMRMQFQASFQAPLRLLGSRFLEVKACCFTHLHSTSPAGHRGPSRPYAQSPTLGVGFPSSRRAAPLALPPGPRELLDHAHPKGIDAEKGSEVHVLSGL